MTGYVALSGHRDLPEDFDTNRLYDALEDLIRAGNFYFCCGMARGFDLVALKCLLDLKQRYHVRIEACIPYLGQENRFPPREKEFYREALLSCDEKTYVSKTYFNGCALVRNRYMVDKCDTLLAYCTRDTGGTAFTVKYARTKGLRIVEL